MHSLCLQKGSLILPCYRASFCDDMEEGLPYDLEVPGLNSTLIRCV